MAAPRPDGVVRTAVIGAIGQHKGFDVLRACAMDAAARDLPLEFTVVGFTEDDDQLLETGKVFITGRYEEHEVQALLEREAPDAALFASVWPETWCYALTHALEAGLPVLAFDIGAIAERLRSEAGGHGLLPLGANAADINDRLLEMARGRRAFPPKHVPGQASPSPQQPGLRAELNLDFAADAQSLSSTSPVPGKPMPQPQSALSISAEVLSLTKGIYRFSVKSGVPRRVGDDEELILPAVHVGPGPGVPAEQVEMMTGLRSDGAWLYEPRDMIIMKVKSGPVPVLMTSARLEGMDPLEISVERLDAPKKTAPRASQPPAAMPALPPPAMSARTLQALAADRTASRALLGGGRAPEGALRLEVMAHISNRGDKSYVDSFWAGELGESLPIEGFSIQPMEGITPDQVEYKAQDANGNVTPWISGGGLCGSRGVGVPLTGFIVRLRDGAEDLYECEYRGAFRSGRSVGPVTNGAPCKALEPDDYLEGIQLTIVKRRKALESAQGADDMPPLLAEPEAPRKRAGAGPRFSVFREDVQ